MSYRDPEDHVDIYAACHMIDVSSPATCKSALVGIVQSIDKYSGDVNDILSSIIQVLDRYGMFPLLDDTGEE